MNYKTNGLIFGKGLFKYTFMWLCFGGAKDLSIKALLWICGILKCASLIWNIILAIWNLNSIGWIYVCVLRPKSKCT